MIPIIKPTPLAAPYFFIPLNEDDYNKIKSNLILYNVNKVLHKDMFVEDLSFPIKFEQPIRYANIFALGDTEFNKKICDTVLDYKIFRSNHTISRQDETSWQCFDKHMVEIINDKPVPKWQTGKYQIPHLDASCSWNCLLQNTGNPKFAMIIKM